MTNPFEPIKDELERRLHVRMLRFAAWLVEFTAACATRAINEKADALEQQKWEQ